MADMRAIGAALEAYAVDFRFFPALPPGGVERLEPHLVPTYAKALPLTDAWRHPLLIESRIDTYTITNLGSDGKLDSPVRAQPPGGTRDFEKDIVFRNGRFVQWPAWLHM
jgi:hypothetical protein